jgi:hypothetical protein
MNTSFRCAVAALAASTFLYFASAPAQAQRRGGAIAAGLAAGVILGAIAAGAASQRATAQPRYRSQPRSAQRSRSTSARSSSVRSTSGSDPFAGVAPTRTVRD